MSSNVCIFCRIAEGTIPSQKVYENKDFIAFLDINPLREGHVQLIPKKHYRWVWDVPNVGEYFEACQKVANALRRTYNTEWVVSLVFGEEVPHAHIWLIPRTPDDGHGGSINLKLRTKPSSEELAKVAERIKTFL